MRAVSAVFIALAICLSCLGPVDDEKDRTGTDVDTPTSQPIVTFGTLDDA